MKTKTEIKERDVVIFPLDTEYFGGKESNIVIPPTPTAIETKQKPVIASTVTPPEQSWHPLDNLPSIPQSSSVLSAATQFHLEQYLRTGLHREVLGRDPTDLPKNVSELEAFIRSLDKFEKRLGQACKAAQASLIIADPIERIAIRLREPFYSSTASIQTVLVCSLLMVPIISALTGEAVSLMLWGGSVVAACLLFAAEAVVMARPSGERKLFDEQIKNLKKSAGVLSDSHKREFTSQVLKLLDVEREVLNTISRGAESDLARIVAHDVLTARSTYVPIPVSEFAVDHFRAYLHRVCGAEGKTKIEVFENRLGKKKEWEVLAKSRAQEVQGNYPLLDTSVYIPKIAEELKVHYAHLQEKSEEQ